MVKASAALIFLVAGALGASATAQAQTQKPAPFSSAMPSSSSPLLPANATKRVSDHVYVIRGFPNVGIVVGKRATLVVDTGLGPRNGTTVLHEAEKLAKNPVLYLTTTHYHPEHASGAQAFPASTVLVRPAAQQQEMDAHGMEFVERFRTNPAYKQFLEGVTLRPADVVFDREVRINLGGVTVRLFWLGAAHTKGDELIFVEEDSTLLPGDIVQNKLVPNMPSADSSPKNWLAILDQLEPLHPRFIVPDHGELGDASLITQERAFLTALRNRALELKGQGKTAADAGKIIADEFKTKYPDWGNLGGITNAVQRVFDESQ